MKNKFISNLGDICLYIALIMICIANIMSARDIKLLENRIDELNAQIQEITVVNEETKQEIQKIASDTDAQFIIINESIDKNQKDNEKLNKEIQDLKKEPEISKEVNEVVEEKAAYEEPVQSMSVDEAVAEPEPEPEPVVESTPEPAPEVEIVSDETNNETSGTYMGVYTLTAYCATGNACADGVMPSCGYTIACNDPSLWHHWVYIEGYGTYYCHDTGGMPSNYIIDIFVGSYDEAINFGVGSANVYIVD